MVQKHNSWGPEANVANALKKLAEYWKRYAEKRTEVGKTPWSPHSEVTGTEPRQLFTVAPRDTSR
jgi:hypothetical protein